jgi:biopolymer transport protein ExbB/TolQ
MTTLIHPMFAANAAVYAIQNATTEGKATVIVLLVLSLFSWTIIITKFRQLNIARKAEKSSSPPTPPRATRWTSRSAARSLTARRPISFTIAARRNWIIS